MQMIKSRQLTSHAYNPEVAEAIYNSICEQYFPALKQLVESLEKLARTNS